MNIDNVPILTEKQAHGCAQIIYSVSYYPCWAESYTPYPPRFDYGMEKGPNFKTRKEAELWIEKQGWKLLPKCYTRAESIEGSILEFTQRVKKSNEQTNNA